MMIKIILGLAAVKMKIMKTNFFNPCGYVGSTDVSVLLQLLPKQKVLVLNSIDL
jgi:hypothetical protein